MTIAITVLDLADRIVAAVLVAERMGLDPTQALMKTLDEHRAWFCHVPDVADASLDVPMPRPDYSGAQDG